MQAKTDKRENMTTQRQLISECCQSGRVTADQDRKLLLTQANEWFQTDFQEDEKSKQAEDQPVPPFLTSEQKFLAIADEFKQKGEGGGYVKGQAEWVIKN